MSKPAYPELNKDQRTLVDAYVEGAVSMADAVIAAGFAQFEGMTEHDVAQRMLASPLIQRAIEERFNTVHDKGIASTLWLLRRMVDYANVEMTDIFAPNGLPLPPHLWPKPLRQMAKRIKLDPLTGALLEVSFEGKTKILELIGRVDLIDAFSKEESTNETVVIIRDMTRVVEAPEPRLVGGGATE